jgi:hypothetical protein
MPYSV